MGYRGRGGLARGCGGGWSLCWGPPLSLTSLPGAPRTAVCLFSGSEASCAFQSCWIPSQEQSCPPRQAGVSSVDSGKFVRPQKGVLLCCWGQTLALGRRGQLSVPHLPLLWKGAGVTTSSDAM